jgi:uncharacterized protein (TIGR02996 family)
MDMQSAFLQAILDAPDDDTPRLVFADWLQDQGDPWGEFLRAQCGPDPADGALALVPRLWKTSLAGVRRWLDPDSVQLERGFIKEARAARDVSRAGVIALATCPMLAPFLWTRNLDVGTLDNIPPLKSVAWERTFNFSGGYHAHGRMDAGVIAALHFPYLPRPTTVELGFLQLRDEALVGLAEAPNVAEVTTLDLGSDHDGDGYESNEITAVGVKALASSPHLASLTTLSLLWNFRIGDKGIRALLKSPHLANLTSLDLSGTGLTDAGARALAASPFVTRLKTLRLWHNPDLGDAGVTALARSPHLAGLEDLDLRGWREVWPNDVGDAGADALAASPHLEHLKRLHVGHWRNATEAGYAALRARFGDRLIIDA